MADFALHEVFMERCLQLALLGGRSAAPNPMVGAVLVFNNKIIGEGYHRSYGGAHAEVNCINSVKESNRDLIKQSTLYVSLEPCNHFGKTPPCTQMILDHEIGRVVVGCRDPFPLVNGKGIEKLRLSGVEVILPVLEEKCRLLNKRFLTFHTLQRPYVILKWAESSDGFIAGQQTSNLRLSNNKLDRMVHKWRSEEMGILIGRRTAELDKPSLTTRLWPGQSPVRIIIDPECHTLQYLQPDGDKADDHTSSGDQDLLANNTPRNGPTIIFNLVKDSGVKRLDASGEGTVCVKLDQAANLAPQIVARLYQLNLTSVLIEGGAITLQSFIDAGLWDEARVIRNNLLSISSGVRSPLLNSGHTASIELIDDNLLTVYHR